MFILSYLIIDRSVSLDLHDADCTYVLTNWKAHSVYETDVDGAGTKPKVPVTASLAGRNRHQLRRYERKYALNYISLYFIAASRRD